MTSISHLPSDDLPLAQDDGLLQRQLDAAIARRLYEACDGVTQSLLIGCEWFVTTAAPALTLVIHCPDRPTNRRVLNNISSLVSPLEAFSSRARIRVCPPPGMDDSIELGVDELPASRDLP